MQIILDIDGHKAIPIRAIPQVTNWNESPDTVVQTLAAPKNSLFAYQMDAQSNYVQVPPEQWESWVVTLKSLTKKLRADEREGAEDENEAPWRIKAILELPDDVFIWLDEFQRWYSLSRPLENVPDDYQNDCLKWESNQERLLAKNRDPNSELSESELAMLDEPRPWSAQASDQLCLTPIFPPAIENRLWRFDFVVASPVAKAEAAPVTSPSDDEQTNPADDADHTKTLAALFDPVPVAALEKMFPTNGKWKKWAEKAKANGLIDAREGTAKFNPYKAGAWFVNRGANGWDTAHLYRTLAKNLPPRSRDDAHLLTWDIE